MQKIIDAILRFILIPVESYHNWHTYANFRKMTLSLSLIFYFMLIRILLVGFVENVMNAPKASTVVHGVMWAVGAIVGGGAIAFYANKTRGEKDVMAVENTALYVNVFLIAGVVLFLFGLFLIGAGLSLG